MTTQIRSGFLGIAQSAEATSTVIAGAHLAARTGDKYLLDAHRALIGDEGLFDSALLAAWEIALSTNGHDRAAAAETLYTAAASAAGAVSPERTLARVILRKAARSVQFAQPLELEPERLANIDMLTTCLSVFTRVCLAAGADPDQAAEQIRDAAPSQLARKAH